MSPPQWWPHAPIWTRVYQACVEVADLLETAIGQRLPAFAVDCQEGRTHVVLARRQCKADGGDTWFPIGMVKVLVALKQNVVAVHSDRHLQHLCLRPVASEVPNILFQGTAICDIVDGTQDRKREW